MDFVRSVMVSVCRWLVIAGLLYIFANCLGLNEAKAQGCSFTRIPEQDSGCRDQGEAAAASASASLDHAAWRTSTTPGQTYVGACKNPTQTAGRSSYRSIKDSCSSGINITDLYRTYPSANTCSARNSDFASDPETLMWAGTPPSCIAGCAISYQNAIANKLGAVTAATVATGRYYTGEICDKRTPNKTSPEATPDEEPACSPAGSGQTYCVKPNGQQCHTTSNGKQFCWNPGQTGVKTDGIDAQKLSDTGDVSIPDTPPTEGDWATHNGHTVSITNTVTNVTTTITVTNFTSTNSKPDKPITDPDITEPGGEDGEEDDGTATAANNCLEVPQCSGGDAIGCALLRQHHALTCRDGSEFPVGLDDGVPESSITKPVDSIFEGEVGEEPTLNMSGWAATGSCPIVVQFSAMGQSYTMDGTWICQVLDGFRALINLLAAIHAGFIIASGFRKA